MINWIGGAIAGCIIVVLLVWQGQEIDYLLLGIYMVLFVIAGEIADIRKERRR